MRERQRTGDSRSIDGLETQDAERLQRLDRLAELLDASIRIPGIGYRVGYEALIGLIPGVGDVVGLLFSSYIIFEAARFRIPKATLGRMVANVVLDFVVGAVPVAGDVFDAAYKANMRNIRLLHDRLDRSDRSSKRDRLFLSLLLFVPLVILGALAALFAYLVSLL